jgi:hypothetical protein
VKWCTSEDILVKFPPVQVLECAGDLGLAKSYSVFAARLLAFEAAPTNQHGLAADS